MLALYVCSDAKLKTQTSAKNVQYFPKIEYIHFLLTFFLYYFSYKLRVPSLPFHQILQVDRAVLVFRDPPNHTKFKDRQI